MKKLLTILTLLFTLIISSSSFGQNLVWATNTSVPAACDGSAYIDTNVVVTNQIWTGGGAVLQNGGDSISGLCAGTYTLTFTDSFGITSSYTFIIGAGNGNPCAGLTALVTTTDATSNLICDGTVSVIAYGGSAPYTYLWNTGAITTLESNLCPGYYICNVTDANGCTSNGSGYVADASAGAMDSILIFVNNSYPGVGVIDTLTLTSIEDCTIDYGSVGSASITNYTYLSVDSLLITWTLLDTNGLIVAVYTVPTLITNPAAGVFSATLIVFCSQKNIDINTINITDKVYLNPAEMGVFETSISDFSVVNPFNDVIQVVLNDNSDGSITLIDMNGRTVLEGNFNNESSINLNTNNIQSGIYILKVEIDGILFTRKLMK
jgi:hypothetical protein